jgi:hypothetical protein
VLWWFAAGPSGWSEVLECSPVVGGGDEGTRGHHVAPSRARESRAPPSPEAMSPSSKDSSRMVCKDGDPLCTIPTIMVPKSFTLGESPRLRKWLAVMKIA